MNKLRALHQEENGTLWSEIDEKNSQLNSKDKLLENMQVLIKQEQKLKQLQWENGFKEVDVKLGENKENMAKKKQKRTWFNKIIKRLKYQKYYCKMKASFKIK